MNIIRHLEQSYDNVPFGLLRAIYVFFLAIILELFMTIPIYLMADLIASDTVAYLVINISAIFIKLIIVYLFYKWFDNGRRFYRMANLKTGYRQLTAQDREYPMMEDGRSVTGQPPSEQIMGLEGALPVYQPEISNKVYKNKWQYRSFFGYVIMMIFGFRLLFDNSIGLFLVDVEMNDVVVEAFESMFQMPLFGLLIILVIAPVYEELFIRKFILGGLLKTKTPFVAIFISALMFSLMHMNFIQGVNTFFVGLLFGYIYYVSGSIFLSILAHFMNNFYAVTFGILQELLITGSGVMVNGIFAVLGAVIMMAGIQMMTLKLRQV